MIAYFFIQKFFKCRYDHYSTIAFGDARTTLWRKKEECAVFVKQISEMR